MTIQKGLNLVLYDRSCVGALGLGLSRAWQGGAQLYRALGRCDGSFGARSWSEGLAWLTRYRSSHAISQVQYWGHGKWGALYLAGEPLERSALQRGHAHHEALERWRDRISEHGFIWFRTCETLGAERGHEFARAWTDFFGCPVAGHTFVIGYWQSGLHQLQPGQRPHWSADEGVLEGTATTPKRAAPSRRDLPRTISCLSNNVPPGW